MREIKYGQVVSVSEKLVRKTETRIQEVRGSSYRNTWKIWKPVPFNRGECIYLGTRTLQNGIREYDYECGPLFYRKESFKAAIISPGPNSKPVYVPLNSIKAAK